jgi:protease I
MAGETLQGMKVAILVTDGFEQVELTEPRKALDQSRRRHTCRLP